MPDRAPDESHLLPLPAYRQPDDVSCGPTCLSKVLTSYGDTRSRADLEASVQRNADGGTLGVYLGQAAMRLGYPVTIYSYNLRVFDPTWSSLSPAALADKLRARARVVDEEKLRAAIEAYVSYLEDGGTIRFDDLDEDLLVSLVREDLPIVVGLSATYLFATPREDPITNAFDDVGGEPSGHFLVVCGYRHHGRTFVVSDPYQGLPMTSDGTYEVDARRLLNAILLGDVTYDGVLLVVGRAP